MIFIVFQNYRSHRCLLAIINTVDFMWLDSSDVSWTIRFLF